MGAFTDLFVRRPVLATVVSLVILLLGLRSIQALNVRQYPETSAAIVTIATPYTGANPELVKGFVTTPLEQVIASANGIDYLDSTSRQGLSVIRAHLELDFDPNAAVAQILTKINQVRNRLPEGSEDPVVTVSTAADEASMYLAFSSDVLSRNQVNDYLVRNVRPRLESIAGVQQANVLGGEAIAMRVWLDPPRMAAHGVTAGMVREAIAANNFLAAVGETRGESLSIGLTADTSLHTARDFERLAVKTEGTAVTRLEDVATVALGAESYESSVYFDGARAVFIAVEVVPTENALDVITRVRDALPGIQRALPETIEGTLVYDATVFIRASIREVLTNLAEALAIVTLVIYLFLGAVRSALVPAVAMPLSLVGAAFLMLLAGFSINLLTLLAMILAIGTVVDDGIVVVENTSRHIEEGAPPFRAAMSSARELAGPIVAMNVVVLAVFAPIGFMTGLTGNLFTEFAYTVAGATLVSGVIALTLSPMMCAKLLSADTGRTGLARRVDSVFRWVAARYSAALARALDLRWWVLAAGAAILVSTYFLYTGARKELAPTEDQGFLIVLATADPNTSLPALERWTGELAAIPQSIAATEHTFVANGIGGGGGGAGTDRAFAGIALRHWSERERSTAAVSAEVQRRAALIGGLQTAVFPPPSLPGSGGGTPVQLVIGATDEPLAVFEAAQALLARMRGSGLFAFADTDLKYDTLQVDVRIDRDKAADLGIDMREVGGDLATLLSGGFVNYFSIEGRSYRVIPQVETRFRRTPEQLGDYQVRTGAGPLVPVASFVRLEESVQPGQLLRFNQLNSATLSAVPAPGVSLGRAVAFLETAARDLLPPAYATDWKGTSRQYVEESTALVATAVLSLLLVWLVLAAQFESFRDPAIMLVSVPMSLAGALAFFALDVVTVNIYTQIGLLALMASIVRHGILLVEFANLVQRRDGLARLRAMEKAAAIRLRPILMTTVATLVGMIPLILAQGPGAESRFAIGFVLGTGMAIGTVFTLFVVPALYTVVARERSHEAPDAPEAAPAG